MTDYDIIIKGGTVVDGTRTPRYVSDIAIKDGKISQIGGLKGKTADRVLDAAGRIVLGQLRVRVRPVTGRGPRSGDARHDPQRGDPL
jgi:predicted amidohydrolase